GRWRLMRQLLTESLMLAAMGCTAGLVLSAWGLSLVSTAIPTSLQQVKDVRMDWTVLGFAVATSLLTGTLCGLMPAIRTFKTNLNDILKEGGKGTASGGSSKAKSLLVITEIALSLVLLVGAGLL